jgi:hypothetical protein
MQLEETALFILSCDTGQHCVLVLFEVLSPVIGRPLIGLLMSGLRAAFPPNFPINGWRPPKFVHFRSRSKRVRSSRGGTQPALSRVTPVWSGPQICQSEVLTHFGKIWLFYEDIEFLSNVVNVLKRQSREGFSYLVK